MKDIAVFLNEQLENENLENNEDVIVESESIKDEDSFRKFAAAKLKKAFGDDYDEDKMSKMVDGILKDNDDLVKKGDWGALVGILNKGTVK